MVTYGFEKSYGKELKKLTKTKSTKFKRIKRYETNKNWKENKMTQGITRGICNICKRRIRIYSKGKCRQCYDREYYRLNQLKLC